MIYITLAGGACPLLPITHALPRAMMYPNEPYAICLDQTHAAIMAVRGNVNFAANEVARAAARTAQPALMAEFDEFVLNACRGLHLFVPRGGRLLAGRVEPCIVKPGAPMILVAEDRSMAFSMGVDGLLVECAVPSPKQFKQGVARAWEELIRRMRTTVTEDGVFLHQRVELFITPTREPAHT